ncbi:MAG: hypothetical protein WA842_03355 [Croceibacterium sp.]
MNMWSFIFLCVVAGLVYDLIRKKQLSRHGHWEDQNGKIQPLVTPRDTELEREVRELRERVKVLERIATDEHDPKQLSAEIERLRDK